MPLFPSLYEWEIHVQLHCQFTSMLPCISISHNLTYLFQQNVNWFTCTAYQLYKPQYTVRLQFMFYCYNGASRTFILLNSPEGSNTWVVKRSQVVWGNLQVPHMMMFSLTRERKWGQQISGCSIPRLYVDHTWLVKKPGVTQGHFSIFFTLISLSPFLSLLQWLKLCECLE